MIMIMMLMMVIKEIIIMVMLMVIIAIINVCVNVYLLFILLSAVLLRWLSTLFTLVFCCRMGFIITTPFYAASLIETVQVGPPEMGKN